MKEDFEKDFSKMKCDDETSKMPVILNLIQNL